MPTNHADGFENKTHEEQEVLKKPAPDGKIFFYSLILPSIFVVLLWLIAIAEKVLGIELNMGRSSKIPERATRNTSHFYPCRF